MLDKDLIKVDALQKRGYDALEFYNSNKELKQVKNSKKGNHIFQQVSCKKKVTISSNK